MKMEQIPVFTSFGDRLKWWIAKRGTSQKALAEVVGIRPPSMNELCSGESLEPKAGTFMRICHELRLRPEYLIWGEGPPEATDFKSLSGLEAQLVMIFRNLPDDAKRDALLIDVNDYYNRHVSKGTPTKADPFGHVAPPPAVTPPAPAAPKVKAKQSAKKVTT